MAVILLTFIAIVLLLTISFASFWYLKVCKESVEVYVIATGIATLIIGGSALICFIFWASEYYSASIKAELLNKEYNTKYTTEQVFYAAEVIDVIHEIKRNRVDLRVNHEQREE